MPNTPSPISCLFFGVAVGLKDQEKAGRQEEKLVSLVPEGKPLSLLISSIGSINPTELWELPFRAPPSISAFSPFQVPKLYMKMHNPDGKLLTLTSSKDCD